MHGVARAPGAISLVNAIPSGRGAAAAIDATVEAAVELDPGASAVVGETEGPDPTLVERCVAETTKRFGADEGGVVRTRSALPASVGLKTSSAAANAAVAATLQALEVAVEPPEIARLGVAVARAVGVTVTGALDDAMASALGGICLTDNRADRLLERTEHDAHVVIVIPGPPRPSTDVDLAALAAVAPLCERALALVGEGRYGLGMTLNGLAVAAALALDDAALSVGLDHADGVTVSGTGPAVAAIGTAEDCAALADAWSSFGPVIESRLRGRGLQAPG